MCGRFVYLLALALAFCMSTLVANAQLRPWDSSNSVLVDFGSVDSNPGARASYSRTRTTLLKFPRSQLSDPPRRTPVSRFLIPGKQVLNFGAQGAFPQVKLIRPKATRKSGLYLKPKVLKKGKVNSSSQLRLRRKDINEKSRASKGMQMSKITPSLTTKPRVDVPPKPQSVKTIKLPPPPKLTMELPPPAPSVTTATSVNKSTGSAKRNSPTQQASLASTTETATPAKVLFKTGSINLSVNAKKGLDVLTSKLNKEGKMRLQLLSYAGERSTPARKARRLSLSRALAVRSYLIGKGVDSTRIDVRALGNKVPTGQPNRVDLRLIGG